GGYWSAREMRPLLTGCERLAGLRDLRLTVPQEAGGEVTLASLGPRLALPGLRSLPLHQGRSASAWAPFVGGCRAPLERLHLSFYAESIEEDTRPPDWSWLDKTAHWPNLRYVGLWYHLNTIDAGHHDRTSYYWEEWHTALPKASRLED